MRRGYTGERFEVLGGLGQTGYDWSADPAAAIDAANPGYWDAYGGSSFSSDPAAAIAAANPGYWDTYGSAPGASPPGSGGSSWDSFLGSLGAFFHNVTGTGAPPSAGSYAGEQNTAATGNPAVPGAAPGAPPSSGITAWIQANPLLAIGGVALLALVVAKK